MMSSTGTTNAKPVRSISTFLVFSLVFPACSGPQAEAPPQELSSPEVAPPEEGMAPTPRRSTLTLASNFVCAVADGGIYCWGGGDGTPRRIEGLNNVVEISASGSRICALDEAGRVSCWMLAEADRYMEHEPREPEPVELPAEAQQIATGEAHACALLRDGTTWCWGENRASQLGTESQLRLGDYNFTHPPVQAVGLDGATQIDAGAEFNCAILAGGQAVCWGNNRHQQLGNVDVGSSRRIPVPVIGLPDAVQLSLRRNSACALRRGGELACWGGYEYQRTYAEATNICEVDRLVALSTDGACGIRDDGTIVCWQIVPQTVDHPPICGFRRTIDGLKDAVELTGGLSLGCARRRSGEVQCWGRSRMGRLGRGPGMYVAPLRPIPDLEDAAQVVVSRDYGCARRSTGSVVCWGRVQECLHLQVPEGENAPYDEVEGAAPAVQILAGDSQLIVLREDGRVLSYETGSSIEPEPCGRLFDEPAEIEALRGARSVSLDGSSIFGVMEDGRVIWAPRRSSSSGGRTFPESFEVARVPDAGEVAGFDQGCCIRRESRRVSCSTWSGEWYPSRPIRTRAVRGLTDAVALHSGHDRAFIVSDTGEVSTWSPESGLEPNEHYRDAAQLAFDRSHGCSRGRSGEVLCWGDNRIGIVPGSAERYVNTPTVIRGLEGVSDVAVGERNICVVRGEGQVVCWGSSGYGVLGPGFRQWVSTPAPVVGLPGGRSEP